MNQNNKIKEIIHKKILCKFLGFKEAGLPTWRCPICKKYFQFGREEQKAWCDGKREYFEELERQKKIEKKEMKVIYDNLVISTDMKEELEKEILNFKEIPREVKFDEELLKKEIDYNLLLKDMRLIDEIVEHLCEWKNSQISEKECFDGIKYIVKTNDIEVSDDFDIFLCHLENNKIQLTQSKIISIIDNRIEELKKELGSRLEVSTVEQFLNFVKSLQRRDFDMELAKQILVLESLKKEVKL